MAPIGACRIASLLGIVGFNPRKFFKSKGNPLAPVPPNIELIMKMRSPDLQDAATSMKS